MCMWNGEWKSSQPREGKYLWMIIDFSSSFHVSLAGTHASPTFINFIHRTIWCVPTLSLFHIDRNISRPTIKKILLHRTLRTPRNRKPIIDGIINVINLHNQYLFFTKILSEALPTTLDGARLLKMISVFALCSIPTRRSQEPSLSMANIVERKMAKLI